MSRLFVTGGSGFVGSRLLPALVDRGHTVSALFRGAARPPAGVRAVRGDLLAPATYREALGASDTVVHLAAMTGRASSADHLRVNAAGTEALLDAGREAGIGRIIFVSSIAAAFPDHRSYPYAQAKVRAEDAVRRAGLPFTIVRPTMIFGLEAPVLEGLAKLALLPVVPVFGDGQTLVQPIHVDDVVRALVRVIEDRAFDQGVFDIGGPGVVPIETLLQRIRTSRRGAEGRTIHVPLGLVLPALRAAEAAGLVRFLPLTAGQLSTFRFAGTASANPLQQAIQPEARTLAAMLDETAGPPERGRLDREGVVFARHLLGVTPTAYVRQKYAEAHRVRPGLEAADRFDALLIGCAAVHPACAALADAYASAFLKTSALRQKLVLLLALLETTAPASTVVDHGVGGGPATVVARLALRGTLAAARLAAGTILFTPARLLLAGRPR